MFNKTIAIIFFILLTACSSEKETKSALWEVSSYSTEINGRHVELSLHSLDGLEDILQADVMIHYIDGSGPSFEVQNASTEIVDNNLIFGWTDGFGNKGTAELKFLSIQPQTNQKIITNKAVIKTPSDNNMSKKKQALLFTLKVDDVINERNMMFIDQYTLIKVSEQAGKSLLQSDLSIPDSNSNSNNTENSEK
jgi:hypothetical protein